MSFGTMLFLAVALAMDAFAVSIASGVAIQRLHVKHALKIAFFFGLFQALMPLVGWLAGLSLRVYIERIDHWVAFGLLGFIGGKMIHESMKFEKDEEASDPLNIYVLLVLSIATSIDALAVGLTFSLLNIVVFTPILIIGAVTFMLSFAGVYIGDHLGHFFESKIELAGGLILIGIGFKILVEHLAA